jgi:hypothetical protein
MWCCRPPSTLRSAADIGSDSVVSGVRGDLFGAADFDVANDGTVVFVAGADPSIGHLAWLDAKGRVDTLALPPANYAGFDVCQSLAPHEGDQLQRNE